MAEDANIVDGSGSDANRTWGSSIYVDGIEYATSLFWQSLQNQDNPQPEVIESSQGVLEGADLFCIKKGKTPQFGICVSSEGYKNNEYVGAPAVATALADQPSFIAVFKVDNGWWYVCVRDDVILANGDMLYLSEEDAKKQFMSMLMVPDWRLKIAPPEWGIEDTLYPDIADIMQRGTRVKLQKINTKGKMFYIVAGAVAFIALYLVYKLFMMLFEAPPAPVIVPIQPKVAAQPEVPPEPKPWENLPVQDTFMQYCYVNTMQFVKILPPGWTIGPISCSLGGTSTSWSRQFGRISIIDKALTDSQVNFSARSIAPDGNTVMAALPLGAIDTENSEPSKNMVDLKNMLNDFFQSIGQTVSLTDYTYTSPQQNVYRSVKFKFSSTYNPRIWSNLLTKFSGLEMNSITYNPDTGVWDYEGAIYAL